MEKKHGFLEGNEEVVFFSTIVAIVSILLVVASFCVDDKSRLEGVIVEGHGVLIELVIFGILAALFLKTRNRRVLNRGEPYLNSLIVKSCNSVVQSLTRDNSSLGFFCKGRNREFIYLFSGSKLIVKSNNAFDVLCMKDIEEIQNRFFPDLDEQDIKKEISVNLSDTNTNVRHVILRTFNRDEMKDLSLAKISLGKISGALHSLSRAGDIASQLVFMGLDHDIVFRLNRLELLLSEVVTNIEALSTKYINDSDEYKTAMMSLSLSIEETIVAAMWLGKWATKDTQRFEYSDWQEKKRDRIRKLNKSLDNCHGKRSEGN